MLILLVIAGLCECQTAYRNVSLGGCVVAQTPQHLLTASSARSCAFLCSQLRLCIGWSYRTGVCNVSDSVQTVRLSNDTDCEVWSVLRQLSLVAFWPMSNATRSRNVASNSGHLDLRENMAMQYTDSAVNFTGQFDVNERFNIDQLASECLTSFTFSVWVKVTNSSRGPMPLIDSMTTPNSLFTRLWLYPNSSNADLSVESPNSQVTFTGDIDNVNNWSHVAAVYNRQVPTLRIYVNGSRTNATIVQAAQVSGCASFGTQVQIGATLRIAYHNVVFQGFMRNFAV